MKLAGLESLRGAAALYVLLHHIAHLNHWTGPAALPFRFGQEAVILFFLISGFVIALAQERTSQPGFRAYFRRRILRIFPIFLAALGLAAVFAPSIAGPDVRTDLPTLVGNLWQLQDLRELKPGVAVQVFGGNAPLWSLSYEWWFYLVFYGLWRWVPDHLRDLCVGVVGGAAVLIYAVAPNQAALFLSYFPIWWAGARLAHLQLSGGPVRWRGLAPLLVVVVLWGAVAGLAHLRGQALSFGHYPILPFRHALVALAMVATALALGRVRPQWPTEGLWPFTRLAGISYAVYVFHYPILASTWFEVLPTVARLAAQIGLVVMLAVLAEYWVQPWINRLFRQRGDRDPLKAMSPP
jgi:peptidoglycan/LPS O-acetylase OafA/YrhL